MDRETAKQEIRQSWKKLFPADGKGKGITCPLCGSGSGKNGTGITENPKNPGQLKCWNCNFTGDAIDLYQKVNGCDYNTAFSLLAFDLGLEIDKHRQNASERPQSHENNLDDKKHADEIKTPQRAAQRVAEGCIADYTGYYKECAARLDDPAATSYLQSRGISRETAAAYRIGYDPAWISPEAVRKQREKGNNWTPSATARVILPVSRNHYIARAIDPNIKDFAKQNETGRGRTGVFNARAIYDDHETVFVTEGVFDALAIIETGAAAIALNSTSNADLLIKRLEKEPTKATLVLCLDNDKAGKEATETLKQGLGRLNISYISADICNGSKDPNEALTKDRAAFEKALQQVKARTAARPDSASAYIDNSMQGDIEKLKAAADRKTGFSKLDEKSGGLNPGLYVIAATSSLGKTTFSLQIADNLAAAGHDVLFFSMEQSRLELVSKSFTRILKQDFNKDRNSLALRNGHYADDMRTAAAAYKERMADRLSIIEGNFNCNISFIGDYIRQYIRRNHTSPIVFIDYLQILQPADNARTMSIKETVDSTVTELKRISREHELTVFVISSVNRMNYMTPIDFEALKESGGIEYTADVIWGLQLQCLNDPLFSEANKIKEKRQKIRQEKAMDPRKIELLCLKNRYGIANFSCGFDYYPQYDLFVQAGKDGFYPYYGENPFSDTTPAPGNGKEITARY